MEKKLALPVNIQDNLILYLCLAYGLLAALAVPGFASSANFWNLLFNLLPLLIVGIGQMVVMLTAGIDLSVTSTVALASLAGAFMMSSDSGLALSTGAGIFLGILLMLTCGAGVGLVNGLTITRLGMPPFMVTLTTMIVFSGLAVWSTASQNIYNLPDAFVDITYQSLLGIPIPLLIALSVVGAVSFILRRTILGQWLYATGMNPKAAYISGVDTQSTTVIAYVVSGLCGAVAAVLYMARLETGSPVLGQHILLDVIGAVVIGGTSLFGGKGKVKWTVYGALFIILLDNSLNLVGLSYFLIMIVKGFIILTAAVVYRMQDQNLKTA